MKFITLTASAIAFAMLVPVGAAHAQFYGGYSPSSGYNSASTYGGANGYTNRTTPRTYGVPYTSDYVSVPTAHSDHHGAASRRVTPADEAYIRNLYSEMFGRTAGQSEVNYWLDAMSRGTSREQVHQSFHDSDEWRRQQFSQQRVPGTPYQSGYRGSYQPSGSNYQPSGSYVPNSYLPNSINRDFNRFDRDFDRDRDDWKYRW